MDPDIFDRSCLMMGECGLGYAAWECAGGIYAPKCFSGEVVWNYKNVTFIPLDCSFSFDDLECLREHRKRWMSTNVVHSYKVYDSRDHSVTLMFGSDKTVTPELNPNPIHYVYYTHFLKEVFNPPPSQDDEDRDFPIFHPSEYDIERNRPILATIPGCVNSSYQLLPVCVPGFLSRMVANRNHIRQNSWRSKELRTPRCTQKQLQPASC